MERVLVLIACARLAADGIVALDRRWPGTLRAFQTGGVSLVVEERE